MQRVIPLLILGLFLVACDGGSSKSDVKQPYGKPSKNVFHLIKYTNSVKGTGAPYIGRLTGTVTIGGKEYGTYLLSDVDAYGQPVGDTVGTEIWMTPFPPDTSGTVTIAGLTDDPTGTSPTIAGTFTPPLSLPMDPPIGVDQPVDVTFTGVIPEVPGEQTIQASGTFKLVSKDETVETPMGSVHNCRHYTGTITLAGDNVPAAFKAVPISGAFWYHDELGAVKAEIPQLGLAGNTEATWDVDDPTGEYRTIKRTGVVSDSNPVWVLSTADVSGEWDADKMTHAKMLLEVRWADDETAKNSTQPVATHPAVRIEFSTAWGIFGYEMVESPVSIFHPEDNGKGYKFYYAYVDEAAKNEPGDNGILYQIKVQTTDPSVTPDIKVTGRIYYHTIPVP